MDYWLVILGSFLYEYPKVANSVRMSQNLQVLALHNNNKKFYLRKTTPHINNDEVKGSMFMIGVGGGIINEF